MFRFLILVEAAIGIQQRLNPNKFRDSVNAQIKGLWVLDHFPRVAIRSNAAPKPFNEIENGALCP
jgi:hypothetical protein